MILDALTDDERYSGFDGDPSLTDSFALESMQSYPFELPYSEKPIVQADTTNTTASVVSSDNTPTESQNDNQNTEQPTAPAEEPVSLDEEFLKTVRGDLQRSKELKERQKNQESENQYNPLEELQNVLSGQTISVDENDIESAVSSEPPSNLDIPSIPEPVVNIPPILEAPEPQTKKRIEDVSLESGAEFASAFGQPKKNKKILYFVAAAVTLLTISSVGAWWFLSMNHGDSSHNTIAQHQGNQPPHSTHDSTAHHENSSHQSVHESQDHIDSAHSSPESEHHATEENKSVHGSNDHGGAEQPHHTDKSHESTHEKQNKDTHQNADSHHNTHEKVGVAQKDVKNPHAPAPPSIAKHDKELHTTTVKHDKEPSHATNIPKKHDNSSRHDHVAHSTVNKTTNDHVKKETPSKQSSTIASHIPASHTKPTLVPEPKPDLKKTQSAKDNSITKKVMDTPSSTSSKSIVSTSPSNPDQTKLIPKPILRDIPTSPKGVYTVQVYATPSRDDAEEWMERLKDKNVGGAFITTQAIRGQTYYRVRFGSYSTRQEAESAAMKLGYSTGWVDRVR